MVVQVNVTGMPVDIHIESSSGHGILDRAAIKAVRRWRFSPALKGNIPVVGEVSVPINFRLVAEEVRYIVEHSGARILLVDPELDEAVAAHRLLAIVATV